MMRRATGRPVIIAFHGSYHGESTLTAALGAEAAEISRGLRGLVAGLRPRALPAPLPLPVARAAARAAPATRRSTTSATTCSSTRSTRPRSPGSMIEPVLGSGGCVAPPDAFWPALTDLCREHDWLLCADEVKTGIGRAGKLFAVERWGVEPDLICLGKALGGGVMPIGALLGHRARAGRLRRRAHRQHLGLAARARARRRSRRSTIFEREPVLENVRELEARGAPTGSAELRGALRRDRRRARRRLLPGDRVRPRPRDARSATPSSRTRSPPRCCAAA